MPLTFSPNPALSFSIDFGAFDTENLQTNNGRWSYICSITVDGKIVHEDLTLRSGTTDRDNPARLAEMLSTFLSFLSAWLEAVEYADRTGRDTENVDLFPADLLELFGDVSDDQLSVWADEVYSAE